MTRRPLPAPTEEVEQRLLAQYLDARGLLWCHVPNGGQRNAIVGAKLKAQGVKRGCPDVLVFTPPPGKFGITGAAIELKRSSGTKSDVTPEQRTWLEGLRKTGWSTRVCFGADEAIDYIEELYGREPGRPNGRIE